MRKLFCVLLSATMALSGYATSATLAATAAAAKTKNTKKCFFPKSRKSAPIWVCDAHGEGLAAVGSSAKSKAGLAFMERMAAADARAQLAQNLRAAAQRSNADVANAANSATAGGNSAWTSRIGNESLEGTKITKRAYGPNGSLYVLMKFGESDVQKLREGGGANHQEQKR